MATYYQAVGFQFGDNNGHLLGAVGEVHSRDGWLKRVFRGDYEKAVEFFKGEKDARVLKYILLVYGLRLRQFKTAK